MTRRFTIWLCWWVFLFLVWMLLVLTQATPELVAGVVGRPSAPRRPTWFVDHGLSR